jgi:xylose isomerase
MLTAPLERVAASVIEKGINPQPRSGQQERLENLWNDYI